MIVKYYLNRIWLAISIFIGVVGFTEAARVELAWQPSEDSVRGYNVYRSQAPSQQASVILNSAPLTNPVYQDRSVYRGVLYYYSVTAVGLDGQESAHSNRVAVIAGEQADLEIEVDPPRELVAGTRATFELNVSNHGGGPNGSILRVVLMRPSQLEWESWSGLDWVCGDTPLRVECESEASLLPGDSSSFSVSFRVDPQVESDVSVQVELWSADGIAQRLTHRITDVRYGLYLPCYLTSESGFSAISLTNHSDSPASLDLTVFDRQGFALAPSGQRISLNPGSQHVELSYERRPFDASQPPTAWLGLLSDNPGVGGLFQFGDRRLAQLDGTRLFTEAQREIFFPRVLAGETAFLEQPAQTYLDIVNPSQSEVKLKLELVQTAARPGRGLVQEVTVRRAALVTLGPKAVLQARPEEIFGVVEEKGGYIRAQALEGDGVIGFERIALGVGSSTVGIGASSSHDTTLHSAQIAQSRSVFTHLDLINTSHRTRSVELLATGELGQLLAPPVFLVLGPGELLTQTLDQIFEFAGSEPISGSLEIRADASGIVGNIIFGDPASLQFAASLPLQGEPLRRLAFDYLASTDEFFTGLAIFNPGYGTAAIDLEVLDSEGALLARAQLELGPRHRISRTLAELVPEVKGRIGGYVRLESSQPVVAQQMFGHRKLHFLSSVPASPLH